MKNPHVLEFLDTILNFISNIKVFELFSRFVNRILEMLKIVIYANSIC